MREKKKQMWETFYVFDLNSLHLVMAENAETQTFQK